MFDLFISSVMAVTTGVIVTLVGIFLKSWLTRKKAEKLNEDVSEPQRKIDGLLHRIRSSDETTVWTAFEEKLPPNYHKQIAEKASAVPIITVANLKGGVGKTTVTANLAAYLDREL